MPDQTISSVTPAVLLNEFPVWDIAGNKLQHVRLLFICGHVEDFYSLAMGKRWKPRTNRDLMDDYLRMTCPIGWRACRKCSEAQS